MRIPASLCLVSVLLVVAVACESPPEGRDGAHTPDARGRVAQIPVPAQAAAVSPMPAAQPAAWPWPVAVSHFGRSRMRTRAHPGGKAVTESGPAMEIEANLVTDDPNLLFAGGPRASVVRPAREVAVNAVDPADPAHAFLEDDLWSGGMYGSAHTAFILLPFDPDDRRPVDIEVRARLLRVSEWTTFELSDLREGQREDLYAAPFELSARCHADSVTVSAPTPGESRGRLPDRVGVSRVLGASWVTQSAEVRDARGRLLTRTGGAGTHRGWAIGYEPAARGTSVAYPVTVTLRVPRTYELEYPIYEWRGVELPHPDARSVRAAPRGPLAGLPPGYIDNDPESRRRICATVLAAADPDATASQRIADVLLQCGDDSLREHLTAEADAGNARAPDLLRALDWWRGLDEATFDRRLAEARQAGDVPGLVVGLMSNINEVDLARIVDAIADVDPRAALPWLRLERELARSPFMGGAESRLCRDDLCRSLDAAIDTAER